MLEYLKLAEYPLSVRVAIAVAVELLVIALLLPLFVKPTKSPPDPNLGGKAAPQPLGQQVGSQTSGKAAHEAGQQATAPQTGDKATREVGHEATAQPTNETHTEEKVFISNEGSNNISVNNNKIDGRISLLKVRGSGATIQINNNVMKFATEPAATNLNMPELTDGTKSILVVLVRDVMGAGFVINAGDKSMTDSFAVVAKDVRAGHYISNIGLNGGSLTPLRYFGLIDDKDQLTSIGVSCLKRVAVVLSGKNDTP